MKIVIDKQAPLAKAIRWCIKMGGKLDPIAETIEVDDELTVVQACEAASALGLELAIPNRLPAEYFLRLPGSKKINGEDGKAFLLSTTN